MTILEHQDFELDRPLRLALVEGGIYLFPEQLSVSTVHTEALIHQTLESTRGVFAQF